MTRGAGGTALGEARCLLLEGAVEELLGLFALDPSLVETRWPGVEAPYDGYFHRATLLHHVAGNPLIAPLPPNTAEVAMVLLDAGAVVDAATRAGPSQPHDLGWTTLGLVASSAEARTAGVQVPLLDLLLDRGADPGARNGGCLMGALYYGETAAAERLARAGAPLDLVAAAGVGDVGRLATFLAGGGEAWARASRLVHYSRVPWPDGADKGTTVRHVLGMALVYAALHGRAGALSLLLEAGADPDHRPPFDHGGTALHWAVMGDRPESVRILLAGGADPEARDADHGATPAGWAARLGRPEAAAALP